VAVIPFGHVLLVPGFVILLRVKSRRRLGSQPRFEFRIEHDQFVFHRVFFFFGVVFTSFTLGGCCAGLAAFLAVLQPVKETPTIKVSKRAALMKPEILIFRLFCSLSWLSWFVLH